MTRKGQKKRNCSQIDIKLNPEKQLSELVDKLLRIATISNESKLTVTLEHQKEINVITKKIHELELWVMKKSDTKDDTSVRTESVTIENFIRWVTDNGGEIKGCSVHHFENYDLGIRVNNDIQISSLVISIPRPIILNLEVAIQSDFKYLLEKDEILSKMPNVALAMFLLYIKFQKDQFWSCYLNILPKSYSTVLYFSLEELEELKGSPTLEIACKQVKSIARQYAYFYKLFHTSQDCVSKVMRKCFTFEEYCWAVSTVMTRQNSVPSKDGTHMVNSLIPLWDLCNHTNGEISTDYNSNLDRIECLSLRDFKADEQFLIFYGVRTNADFFIHNGFVYEENIHDGYWLKLNIAKADPLKEKRTALLKKLDILPNSEYFITNRSEPVDAKLLSFLRIFNMSEAQLDQWLENQNPEELRCLEYNGFDPVLEKKAWTFLHNRLQLLLNMYPTNLKEDEILLKENNSISTNKRLAIQMRVTEKRILTTALEYTTQRISAC